MTRTEFITELGRLLRTLPQEEIDRALSYYSEYLADAEDENAAMAALGSPKEVAGLIIAALAADPKAAKTRKTGGMRTSWMVTLAAFAFPVLLPVAAAVCVCLIALLAVLLALFAVSAAFLILGAGYLLLGFAAMAQDFAIGAAVFGSGLFLLGSGWLLLAGLTRVWRASFNWLTRRIGSLIISRKARP
ncbi:MAG: DUF1700 domain-containing protein [Propionibacteriaceae bacterium]|jgi:uncharacterized membrane protein|nr:DUF1700 domain-containing protein [Propionibacteriaceae bacterium]